MQTRAFADSPTWTWTQVGTLPIATNGARIDAYNHYLYLAGGSQPPTGASTSVYFTSINADGSLGPITPTTPLPMPSYTHGLSACDGYLYLFGPGNNQVFGAPIEADGSIGAWKSETSLPISFSRAKTLCYSGSLYVVGGGGPGFPYASVYRSEVAADGSLSGWTSQTPLPLGIFEEGLVLFGNKIITVGGQTDVSACCPSTQRVLTATIASDGSIGPWTDLTPTPEPLVQPFAAIYGGYLVVPGSLAGDQLRPTGGCCQLAPSYAASLAPDGSLGSWSAITAPPIHTYDDAVISTPEGIYVFGGLLGDPGPTAAIFRGTLQQPDTTPPTIQCGSPDGNWHASDATITCSAADSGSGLANPDDAAFTLSTNVASGTETSDASTGAHEVCDNANNCATAGPISGNKIDKAPPTIAVSSPAPGTFALNQAVTSSYSCSDAGSGVQTCAGPAASGDAVDTGSVGPKSFTVSAKDNVGNTSAQSVGYQVKYEPAGSACAGDGGHTILQPVNADGTSVFKRGSTVPAKFRVCDANGASIGTPGVVASFVLQSTSSDPSTTVNEQVLSTTPDTAFRWDPNAQQWIFNISTNSLQSGTKYNYEITLNDGSKIDFSFALK